MNRILLLDTETRSLEPSPTSILEVGAVLWDIDTRSVISAWSEIILRPMENAAESTNRIPAQLLAHGMPWREIAWRLERDVLRADVLLAHNAIFDRKHLEAAVTPDEEVRLAQKERGEAENLVPLGVLLDPKRCPPWCCTLEDLRWPHASSSKSLIAIALAHDVGVVQAHRALADAMLMARLFERVAEMGTDIRVMIAYGLRPKGFFKALVPYEERARPKEAGFRWNEPVEKEWTRSVALDDVSALGFPVERIERDGSPWKDPALCNTLCASIRARRPVMCGLGVAHEGLHSALLPSGDAGPGKPVSW